MGEEHSATLGCLLEDKDGSILGVVNKHAALHADKGEFYLKSQDGNAIVIGSCVSQKHTSDSGDDEAEPDIDLISIDESMLERCYTNVFDPGGQRRHCKIYGYPLKTIYGLKVFKCHPNGASNQENNRAMKTTNKTPQHGRVAPLKTHRDFSDVINSGEQFLVGCDSCEPFSQEGESGTVIGLDNDNQELELVGIICSGKLRMLANGKSALLSNLTLCLSFREGLKFLCQKYGRILKLPAANDEELSCQTEVLVMIQAGTTIFFKTPEYIEPLAFDLCHHIMRLLCIDGTDQINLTELEFIQSEEKKLRAAILDRSYFETWIFDIDRGDQYTLHNCYKACQYLYGDDSLNAEKHLKMASRSLGQYSKFHARFVCKLVSYATWCFLQLEKYEITRILLDNGLEYMHENASDMSIPKESLPYQYYDYSRYHMLTHDRKNAEVMASKSMNIFKDQDDEDMNQDSANRVIMSSCQYVGVRLGCGDDFTMFTKYAVTADDIAIADKILRQLKKVVKEAPIVRKAEYLLNVSDLAFRKGNLKKALKSARELLTISKQGNMEEESRWAGKRIEYLNRSYMSNATL